MHGNQHSDTDKRRRLEKFYETHHAAYEAWVEAGYPHGTTMPACPPDLVGMTCGATTRSGTPCKLTSIWRNGRCKFHGGMSTGPKTIAGKGRSAANPKKLTDRKIEPREGLTKAEVG